MTDSLRRLAATILMLGLAIAASARADAADMPAPAAIRAAIEEAHKLYANETGGKNADYIPYLATVPSKLFGIAVVTADGQVFEVGDTGQPFAIESVSKVFTLALVMGEIGPDALRQKIGANPTGLPFNSVMAIELHKGSPLNPFVNAGAIATTSLVAAGSADERWQKIFRNMGRFAGRELSVNEEVYRSEAASNQHNRGIAWLLQSYGYMYSDPIEATDVYTRQCSVAITTRDLAVMGATLANGGTNPITHETLVARANVPRILAEMTMNGLYDSTGTWQYETGLPAKSGVGGGIVAVVPGRLAVAAFSPPLDEFGNSVRAQAAIRHIATQLKLNLFDY